MTAIEALTSGEFELLGRWLSLPSINRWLTAEWRGKAVTSTIVAIAVRNRRNRMFLVRHDGIPCGLVALSELEPGDRTAMAWYLLGETHLSGRGIITDALRQMLVVAFNELGLCSVYAWAMEPNGASIRVLRKSGFHDAGRIRLSAQLDGQAIDRLYFDITAAEAMRDADAAAPRFSATYR